MMGADGLFFYREFLLTRPSRGVTRSSVTAPLYSGFLLTRPSRGVTYLSDINSLRDAISTHTPLAGRD